MSPVVSIRDEGRGRMCELYQAAMAPHLLCPKYPQEGSENLERAFTAIPKCDFHCHLNGSISAGLLNHMEILLASAEAKGTAVVDGAPQSSPTTAAQLNVCGSGARTDPPQRSSADTARVVATEATPSKVITPHERMQYCFSVFTNIYRVMTNLAFTRLAVQDLLWCSAAENILVLEIRTSLRDGLRATFGQSAERADPCSRAEVVTKQEYLETVISTVEHVLRGGVVDLATGELMPLDAEDRDGVEESYVTRFGKAWWATVQRLYHHLLPEHHRLRLQGAPDDAHLRDELYTKLVTRVLHHTRHRMHVRLSLSVNRGNPVETAQETAALAHAIHQHQIYQFYQWCTSDEVLRQHSSAIWLPEKRDLAPNAFRDAHPHLHDRLRRTCWMTGIDFAGNCYTGSFADFLPSLQSTRKASPNAISDALRGKDTEWRPRCPMPYPPSSLGLTLHGGEKEDAVELAGMMAEGPERWGHLVFAHATDFATLMERHDGIEMCVTSNLLTSGHEDIADHHIDRVMTVWWAHAHRFQGVAATPPPPPLLRHLLACRRVYSNTEEARLARRLRRWGVGGATSSSEDVPCAAGPAVPPCEAPLPNVAFHTDDRGVFATSLSHELCLLAHHPAVWGPTDTTRARPSSTEVTAPEHLLLSEAMWYLQRLALLQLFELPWPVLLLTLYVAETEQGAPTGTEAARISPVVRSALERMRREASPAASSWTASWSQWVKLLWEMQGFSCREEMPSGGEAVTMSLPAALSEWEWQWLTDCFDQFFTVNRRRA